MLFCFILPIILFIDSNGIGDEGAKAIGAALINNFTLTVLSLRMCSCFSLLWLLLIEYNRIGVEGAEAIRNAEQKNHVCRISSTFRILSC